MAVGSYMGKTFTVSRGKILTPSNIKGSTGSSWTKHDVIGGKPRSEYVGAKLKSYTFDLLLRWQDGVDPRSTLQFFQNKAESGEADWFIIGNAPVSPYPFALVECSDAWDAVIAGGKLIECKISLTLEEYATGQQRYSAIADLARRASRIAKEFL